MIRSTGNRKEALTVKTLYSNLNCCAGAYGEDNHTTDEDAFDLDSPQHSSRFFKLNNKMSEMNNSLKNQQESYIGNLFIRARESLKKNYYNQ